tara:strand:- start:14 stop:622 length:609 start_codon:yes stop_codon:yes gene_type:complete
MEYLSHLIIGVLTAYIGLLAPGMLNMTAVQIAIDKGRKRAYLFSTGASVVILFQAGIALVFTSYLHGNPQIIRRLETIAVFVFFALAIAFFVKTRLKFTYRKRRRHKGRYFLWGVGMSLMNMLAIPFYLGVSTYLGAKGFLLMGEEYTILFVVGIVLGAVLLFFSYISLSKIVKKKVSFIAKNINYLLSILFLLLGIVAWFH